MCLDLLTTKRTLKKDKKVWKCVAVANGKEYPFVRYWNRFISFPKPKHLKKRNIATKKIVKTNFYRPPREYETGFHCFITKADTLSYARQYSCGGIVLDYIIPAETKVQYGWQDNQSIVVSPVLLNPRMAK